MSLAEGSLSTRAHARPGGPASSEHRFVCTPEFISMVVQHQVSPPRSSRHVRFFTRKRAVAFVSRFEQGISMQERLNYKRSHFVRSLIQPGADGSLFKSEAFNLPAVVPRWMNSPKSLKAAGFSDEALLLREPGDRLVMWSAVSRNHCKYSAFPLMKIPHCRNIVCSYQSSFSNRLPPSTTGLGEIECIVRPMESLG